MNSQQMSSRQMNRKVLNSCRILLLAIVFFSLQVFAVFPVGIFAGQTKDTVKVYVDGTKYEVRALNQDYDNNVYLSMNDMSIAMANTNKAFVLEWTTDEGNTVAVLTKVAGGVDASDEVLSESEGPSDKLRDEAEDEDNHVNYSRKRMKVHIEDEEYSIYVIPVNEDNEKDCYVNLGEFALAMNIDVENPDDTDGVIYINSKNEFDFREINLDRAGVAFMADSILVGDATSGEIYYSSNADETVAIASTSKLMTYLLIKEALSEGKISMSDKVTFSEKASELSNTSDGVIHVSAGQSADIEDVIKGMLIVSSNECALALAEHLCGDEQAFVELMNQKVKALGMSETARFYNPHGLPMYLDDVLNIKQSNHLTANDMFILSSYILEKYPEVTDITSIKKTQLPSLGNFKAQNTNSLLYNVPGTVGLKTGTTDKAASCLVSSYRIEDGGGNPHFLTCIVYGAENSQTQGYVSMVMMRYAIAHFNETKLGILPTKDNEETPENFDELLGAVLGAARRNAK